jgi:hypothetical protein
MVTDITYCRILFFQPLLISLCSIIYLLTSVLSLTRLLSPNLSHAPPSFPPRPTYFITPTTIEPKYPTKPHYAKQTFLLKQPKLPVPTSAAIKVLTLFFSGSE